MTNINVSPRFVLAGEATFTVSNGVGDHKTYHVYKAAPSERYPNPAYFARMLMGPDNTDFDSYKYVGQLIMPNGNSGDPDIKVTSRSPWAYTHPNVRILRWSLRVVWQVDRGTYVLPPQYSIKHEGRCGRCGAVLTHPVSIDTGLGPGCASIIGVEWTERTNVLPLSGAVLHG